MSLSSGGWVVSWARYCRLTGLNRHLLSWSRSADVVPADVAGYYVLLKDFYTESAHWCPTEAIPAVQMG